MSILSEKAKARMSAEQIAHVERIERERERLANEYTGRHFVLSFAEYLMDPEPLYLVKEKMSSGSWLIHATKLSEVDARALAAKLEAEYPNGTPPGYTWDKLPEENKQEVRRILAREAERLLSMRLELEDKQRRGTLTKREAEALALRDKKQAGTLSDAEQKRHNELCSTWPWPAEENVAIGARPKTVKRRRDDSAAEIARLRDEIEQLRAELQKALTANS